MLRLFSEPNGRLFLLKTVLPILAAGLIVTLGASSLILWATHEADRVSIERQHRLVELVVSQLQSDIAHDQESATVWDDAVSAVRRNDLEWIDVNLGSWMHSYFGHDAAYVLDPADRLIYEFSGNAPADKADPAGLMSVVAPRAAELRSKLASGDTQGLSERVLTIGVADLSIVSGRPAVLSVKPIVSDTGEIAQVSGQEYLHVAVRYLDGSFVTDLSKDYLLEGLRFSWNGEHSGREALSALRSANGDRIGFFAWTPYRPGSAVLQHIAPLLLGLGAFCTLLLGLLVGGLRKRSLKLSLSEATVRHLAHHDLLTGLANRVRFNERVDETLRHRRALKGTLALLYLDLDRFKQVNDTYGHPAGDDLLREFGDRLRRLTRHTDVIARFGGDEFTILLGGVQSEASVADLCRRLIETARHPFAIAGTQVFVGVSVGVALSGAGALDRTELTRRADVALYHAKAAGRSIFSVYSPEMDDDINARRDLERDLREALETTGQLQVHYQPLFSAAQASITGVEALLRWHHPRRGWIAPDLFVPLAEDAGLIDKLGEWVLNEACQTAQPWPVDTLAVNVSAIQLRNPAFAMKVANILMAHGFNPRRLELEVTETTLSESGGEQNIAALRDLGVRIALDDFGTGFSSLGRLHQLDVDRIKIDRSFVQGFGKANGDEAIVQAIVDLARATGLKTTAEGVETQSQRDSLKAIGCDELQGFLLSKPLPGAEIVRLFSESPRLRGVL